MRLLAVGLVSLLCTACVTVQVMQVPQTSPAPSTQASPLATATPKAAPSAGRPGASSSPTTPPTRAERGGVVNGFVYGQAGKGQPIAGALVTSGSASTYTGNPDATASVAEEDEFANEADAKQAHFQVLHDFNDGNGAVPTERILRKFTPDEDPDADTSTNERRAYVYLRAGEFFLEGLQTGTVELTASFGNSVSPAQAVTVPPDRLVSGVVLSIPLPEAVGGSPAAVEWTASSPETGVSVAVATSGTPTNITTTLTFKPDPPIVTLTLKAPPGSKGTTIKGVDLSYTYNTPARQAGGQPPVVLGPVRIPVGPIVVGAAQAIAFGSPAQVPVNLDNVLIHQAFRSNIPDQQTGLIVANMQFIDENDEPVQDRNAQPLQASATIRVL